MVDACMIHDYFEASALTKDGIRELYQEAFNAAWIGPVRFVMRMKSVKPSFPTFVLPCLFKRFKTPCDMS